MRKLIFEELLKFFSEISYESSNSDNTNRLFVLVFTSIKAYYSEEVLGKLVTGICFFKKKLKDQKKKEKTNLVITFQFSEFLDFKEVTFYCKQ